MLEVAGREGGEERRGEIEMLHRAASNAYSWWWASNIRTKQSKWLDSNLQEMEEKVRNMVKLIEVDADSFAKKAEMYYQRRPELLNFVEETYRSYKALADRYDRISGELHKANHTLASAFPDQFQLAMQDEDEDEDGSPKAFTAIDTSKIRKTPSSEVPRINLKNKGGDASSALKKQHKKVSSHITKESAQKEIDRLQKEILVLQTEREFVKSSYEGGLAKFWVIESQITDLQDEVCTLQDEFSASSIIEDDEARALMAATAIKSCEESLVSLHQHQKKSGEEARIESKRISEAKNKIMILKGEECSAEMVNSDNVASKKDEEAFCLKNTGLDLHSICLQVKQHFQMNSDSSVVDLAERIDELVEKVISLEVTVSSQNAQIRSLRSETDELQKHLRGLEEDKANLIIDSNSLNVRVMKAEDELHRVQDLEKSMHHENGVIQKHFAEACNSLNDISEKLQSPRCVEKDYSSGSSNTKNLEYKEVEEKKAVEGSGAAQEDEAHVKLEVEPNAEDINDQSQSNVASSQLANTSEKSNGDQLVGMVSSLMNDGELDDKDDIPDWQQLLNNGSEGRQKMLLYEYTSILRNYKDTKKRLTEMEKKNQEYHFEMMAQIQELKSANAVKDHEIRALRKKLLSHTASKDSATSQKEENGSSQVFTPKSHSPTEIINTEEEVKLCHLDQNHSTSPIEEKFRAELDTLLEENLDFWLRFSTSYHLIQKFESSFKELKAGLERLNVSKEAGSDPTSPKHPSKPETTPLDKKLRELHTELQVWLEQNGLLKGELRCRFTSLCNMQEEISKASRDNDGEDSKFTPYQAAKFQGEVLNMQQENNKVSKELQTGLDHVKALQPEVAKALSKLRESLDFSGSDRNNQYHNFRQLSTKPKVPLRTFLFGEKKKKTSIFSCMSPALHRHHGHMKPGFPT